LYGMAGAIMTSFIQLTGRTPSIIVPDHRGSGYSTPLDCGFDTNASECIRILNDRGFTNEDLQQISVTNAARDHIHLYRNERALLGSRPFYVYGVSYGSFLLSKILLIEPNIADRFVADGLAPPGTAKIMQYDSSIQQSGILNLQRCMENSVCLNRMSLDPVGFAAEALDNIDVCPVGLELRSFKSFLAQATMNRQFRPLVAPALFRLRRCSPSQDYGPLLHLADYIRGSADTSKATEMINKLFQPHDDYLVVSRAMQNIIIGSELLDWARPPMSAELEDRAARQRIFSLQAFGINLRDWYQNGVEYPPNQYHEQVGTTTRPFLLLSSDTDPQTGITSMATPYAAIAETQPRTRHIIVPDATHGVIIASPVRDGGVFCGMQIMVSFLSSENGEVNTSCLSQLQKVDYAASSPTSRQAAARFFGTQEPWD
jgi:pimeloyl-ACP methyl ester carboxylesterase